MVLRSKYEYSINSRTSEYINGSTDPQEQANGGLSIYLSRLCVRGVQVECRTRPRQLEEGDITMAIVTVSIVLQGRIDAYLVQNNAQTYTVDEYDKHNIIAIIIR